MHVVAKISGEWLDTAASSASHRITHAIVAAARFPHGGDAEKARGMVEAWRKHVLLAELLPPRGRAVLIIVDNCSPKAVEKALRAACTSNSSGTHPRIIYARNDAWVSGYGFELGAWRWAMRHVLPSLGLVQDALVYFVQDSLRLALPALPYPPPAAFQAAPLLSFPGLPPGERDMGVGDLPVRDEKGRKLDGEGTWAAVAAAAVGRVRGAPPMDPHAVGPFTGCFGPNMLATWAAARSLMARGFFEMLKVRSKVDEQISERLIGWLLSHALLDDSAAAASSVAASIAPSAVETMPKAASAIGVSRGSWNGLHHRTARSARVQPRLPSASHSSHSFTPCSVGGSYFLSFLLPGQLQKPGAQSLFAKEFANRSAQVT
jgi:hypothetical protein